MTAPRQLAPPPSAPTSTLVPRRPPIFTSKGHIACPLRSGAHHGHSGVVDNVRCEVAHDGFVRWRKHARIPHANLIRPPTTACPIDHEHSRGQEGIAAPLPPPPSFVEMNKDDLFPVRRCLCPPPPPVGRLSFPRSPRLPPGLV